MFYELGNLTADNLGVFGCFYKVGDLMADILGVLEYFMG